MSNELLILGGFGVVLIVFFIIILLKDMETSRKFARYEKVLEGIIQENYNLKKQLSNISDLGTDQVDADEIEARLERKINELINSKIKPVIQTLHGIENSIDTFQIEQQNRLYTLEERTKNINKITSSRDGSDEARIIELYRSGKDIEFIAKNLRLGVGKVELVLKLNKLL